MSAQLLIRSVRYIYKYGTRMHPLAPIWISHIIHKYTIYSLVYALHELGLIPDEGLVNSANNEHAYEWSNACACGPTAASMCMWLESKFDCSIYTLFHFHAL